jgi:hypothetical protein
MAGFLVESSGDELQPPTGRTSRWFTHARELA